MIKDIDRETGDRITAVLRALLPREVESRWVPKAGSLGGHTPGLAFNFTVDDEDRDVFDARTSRFKWYFAAFAGPQGYNVFYSGPATLDDDHRGLFENVRVDAIERHHGDLDSWLRVLEANTVAVNEYLMRQHGPPRWLRFFSR